MIDLALVTSPIGPLTLAARGSRLCALQFGDTREALIARWRARQPGLEVKDEPDPAGVGAVLRDYFAGDIHALDRVTVEMDGTPFQCRVWNALRTVRAGRTASYSDIARAIGLPAAVRAVGAANGANPIAVVVPCHRIIGAGGSLTGYGGGLDRKRWLLEHEGVLLRI
jgi:methylated-DNA-[protein]-cysteine S-methyltransferase